ncbi:MAG TPA: AMP-binding protein [Usitatibacteraceae bacterium]|nr:AMP-binding protein [Usitatibacteraceae bacterium]
MKPWIETWRRHGIPETVDVDAHPSVVHLMEGAMRRYADKVAFRSFGRALTYGELDRLSGAFCAWLQHRAGVKKGDRVAVMMPNLLAFPIACLGILRAGAVQVNVNPLYTPRELEHQLADAGTTLIVIFDGSTPTLAEVIAKTPVKHVVTTGLGDGSGTKLPGPAVDARLEGTVKLVDALADGAGLAREPVDIVGSDPAFLQYTGGTTGLSKGACLSHRNLVANTMQFRAVIGRALGDGDDVIVTALPLYHIFALMVSLVAYGSAGAESWLVANPRDLDGLADLMKAARPTAFAGVNTLYAGLGANKRLGDVDFSRLRFAVGGGSSILPSTAARWKAVTGTVICEGYGLSETSPVLTLNPPGLGEFSGTTGVPLPGTDIVLLGEGDREVAVGETGEVCAKGPQVMAGYWNQPEANRAAFTKDGYFRTGDIGRFDERGFLKLVDRKKDMVLVSGFNVYPNEVEAVASAVPGVAECACIGVADERTGEALRLFVVRSAGSDVTDAAIVEHCRKELAAYKVPKDIRFIDALPKSTVGKILRRELRGL